MLDLLDLEDDFTGANVDELVASILEVLLVTVGRALLDEHK